MRELILSRCILEALAAIVQKIKSQSISARERSRAVRERVYEIESHTLTHVERERERERVRERKSKIRLELEEIFAQMTFHFKEAAAVIPSHCQLQKDQIVQQHYN